MNSESLLPYLHQLGPHCPGKKVLSPSCRAGNWILGSQPPCPGSCSCSGRNQVWGPGLSDSGACVNSTPWCLVFWAERGARTGSWYMGLVVSVALFSSVAQVILFLLLAASSAFIPSCHFSSLHKLPFSGDSVVSSCPYFCSRVGSNGLGQVGQH